MHLSIWLLSRCQRLAGDAFRFSLLIPDRPSTGYNQINTGCLLISFEFRDFLGE